MELYNTNTPVQQ